MENSVVYDAIAGVDAKVEYNGESINSLQQDTAALLTKGAVKSVQRGKTSPLPVETVNSKKIPISAINLSKSVLIINYLSAYNAIDNLGVELYQDYIHLTMNNSSGNYKATVVFSWQVVEFY